MRPKKNAYIENHYLTLRIEPYSEFTKSNVEAIKYAYGKPLCVAGFVWKLRAELNLNTESLGLAMILIDIASDDDMLLSNEEKMGSEVTDNQLGSLFSVANFACEVKLFGNPWTSSKYFHEVTHRFTATDRVAKLNGLMNFEEMKSHVYNDALDLEINFNVLVEPREYDMRMLKLAAIMRRFSMNSEEKLALQIAQLQTTMTQMVQPMRSQIDTLVAVVQPSYAERMATESERKMALADDAEATKSREDEPIQEHQQENAEESKAEALDEKIEASMKKHEAKLAEFESSFEAKLEENYARMLSASAKQYEKLIEVVKFDAAIYTTAKMAQQQHEFTAAIAELRSNHEQQLAAMQTKFEKRVRELEELVMVVREDCRNGRPYPGEQLARENRLASVERDITNIKQAVTNLAENSQDSAANHQGDEQQAQQRRNEQQQQAASELEARNKLYKSYAQRGRGWGQSMSKTGYTPWSIKTNLSAANSGTLQLRKIGASQVVVAEPGTSEM